MPTSFLIRTNELVRKSIIITVVNVQRQVFFVVMVYTPNSARGIVFFSHLNLIKGAQGQTEPYP